MAKTIKPKVPMFRLSLGVVKNSKFNFKKTEHPKLDAAFAAGKEAMRTGAACEVIIARHLVAA